MKFAHFARVWGKAGMTPLELNVDAP